MTGESIMNIFRRWEIKSKNEPSPIEVHFIWLVVWNMNGLFFHTLGMSSSQLTFTPSFFRGVGTGIPPTRQLFGMI